MPHPREHQPLIPRGVAIQLVAQGVAPDDNSLCNFGPTFKGLSLRFSHWIYLSYCEEEGHGND